MFDIGFPELLIVSIVALLVVGPDRLPGAIRSMSLWVGRFRRSFTNIKQEIEKEIGADEIRAQLYNESIMQDFEKTKEAFEDIQNDVNKTINSIDASASELKSAATATPESSLPKSTSQKSTAQKSTSQKSTAQKSAAQKNTSENSFSHNGSSQNSSSQNSWAKNSKHEKLESQTNGPEQSSV